MLQSVVEHNHRRRLMSPDVLAKTVYESWSQFDAFEKFGLVHERWKKVLLLILLGNGSNKYVEECRGLKTSLTDLAAIVLSDNDDDDDDFDGECRNDDQHTKAIEI